MLYCAYDVECLEELHESILLQKLEKARKTKQTKVSEQVTNTKNLKKAKKPETAKVSKKTKTAEITEDIKQICATNNKSTTGGPESFQETTEWWAWMVRQIKNWFLNNE